MKKTDTILKEYVKHLSDDQLRYLNSRYTQQLNGDRAEVTELLQADRDLDRWLSNATGAVELFDMLDQIGELIKKEAKKRLTSD